MIITRMNNNTRFAIPLHDYRYAGSQCPKGIDTVSLLGPFRESAVALLFFVLSSSSFSKISFSFISCNWRASSFILMESFRCCSSSESVSVGVTGSSGSLPNVVDNSSSAFSLNWALDTVGRKLIPAKITNRNKNCFIESWINYLPPAGRCSSQYLAIVLRR